MVIKLEFVPMGCGNLKEEYMATDVKIDTTISCLMHSVEGAQETIRAYDNKAEILGILLTLAIGITNYTHFEHCTGWTKWMLLSSWVVALIAITALGFVLHPMTNPFKNIALGNFTPSGTYFLSNLSSAPQNTVTTLADRAINTDWVSELMYENMKLSSAQIHLFGRAKAELGEGQECVGTGISRSAAFWQCKIYCWLQPHN